MAQNKKNRSGNNNIKKTGTQKKTQNKNTASNRPPQNNARQMNNLYGNRPPFARPEYGQRQSPQPMWDQSRQTRQQGVGGPNFARQNVQRQQFAQQYTQQQQFTQQYTQQQQFTKRQRPPQGGQSTQKKRPPQSKHPPKQPPPKKRKLTPEEIEARKKRAEAEKKRQQELRRQALQILWARFVLFLCTFGVLLVFTTGCLALSIFTGNNASAKPFTFSIKQSIAPKDAEPVTETVSGSRAMIGGECYVNFTKIAGLYDFIMTGDHGVYRFLSDVEGTQSVTFTVGSGNFEINGVKGRFAEPAVMFGDELYIPAHFINSFTVGLTVECDTDNRIIVLTRENDSKLDSFVDLHFTLISDSPSTHVEEGSLDEDILLMTAPFTSSNVIDNYVDPTVGIQ